MSSLSGYYDEEGFDNYVAKTQNAGPWMLIGVFLYSVSCVLVLPVLVSLGRRRQRRQRRDRQRWRTDYQDLDLMGGSVSSDSGNQADIEADPSEETQQVDSSPKQIEPKKEVRIGTNCR